MACTASLNSVFNYSDTPMPTAAPTPLFNVIDNGDAALGMTTALLVLIVLEWFLLFGASAMAYPRTTHPPWRQGEIIGMASILMLAVTVFIIVVAATDVTWSGWFFAGVLLLVFAYFFVFGYIILHEMRPHDTEKKEKPFWQVMTTSDRIAFFAFIGIMLLALMTAVAFQASFGVTEAVFVAFILFLLFVFWFDDRLSLTIASILLLMYAFATFVAADLSNGWVIASAVILITLSVGMLCWIWTPWDV